MKLTSKRQKKMVKIIYCVLFLFMAGICMSFPIENYHNGELLRQRPDGALGAIGTALVPIIGNLLRPIITNLALGLSNALSIGLQNMNNPNIVNITRPTRPLFHKEKPHHPHWDAYLVQIPGSRTPYMLLNDGEDSEEALKEAIISSITFPIPGAELDEEQENKK